MKLVMLCDCCRMGSTPIKGEIYKRVVKINSQGDCALCGHAVFTKRVDNNWEPNWGLSVAKQNMYKGDK